MNYNTIINTIDDDSPINIVGGVFNNLRHTYLNLHPNLLNYFITLLGRVIEGCCYNLLIRHTNSRLFHI